MITVPAIVRRALRAWQRHIEARQRAKRLQMMLRVSPDLRAAHDRLERDRRRHAATKADRAALRAATTDMLRRSVGA